MKTKKLKPVYSVTAFGEHTPAAIYSCLMTLCEQWGVADHYQTIWKHLKNYESPYDDHSICIKKHNLIRSSYTRKPAE